MDVKLEKGKKHGVYIYVPIKVETFSFNSILLFY